MTPVAPKLRHFHALTPPDVNVEYQVHTTQTDGEGTIVQILARARQQALDAIAFTEHVRMETNWFPAFAQAVRAAAADYNDLIVYVGCEAKALNMLGALDVTGEILAECNLVLGSVHRFPDGNGGYVDWRVLSDQDFARTEFDLAMGLIQVAPIHVLAHPGGMFQRQRHKPFPTPYLREMMEAGRAFGVAIEINTSYLVDVESFLELCAEIDPIVSIGSDAHKLDEIAHCRDMLRGKGIGM